MIFVLVDLIKQTGVGRGAARRCLQWSVCHKQERETRKNTFEGFVPLTLNIINC